MKTARMLLVIFFSVAAAWLFWKHRETSDKRPQTSNDIVRLQRGITAYYDAYNKLPPFTTPIIAVEGPDGAALLQELLGDDPGSSGLSVRRQHFIDPQPGESRSRRGLIYENPAEMKGPQGFYDVWGQPFRVAFDHDYNDEIFDPLMPGNIIRNERAVVFSYGPDRKPGGGDDIKTW